jgi:MYXO-CTERM domain-containing protein
MSSRFFLGALAATAVALGAISRDARACGGCFHPPTQDGDVITDERMIYRITMQQTTLYDEIEYSGNPASFAWVLPIHGQVTVGLSSDVVFAALDAATQTTLVAPSPPICPAACYCAYGEADGSTSADAGALLGPVTVLSQQTVGPYSTVQLQSTDPAALDDWLAANGFVVPTNVQPVIAAYVQEGFDFLALKLAPGQGVSAMRPVRVTSTGGGLSLPLRMIAVGTGATVGLTLWIVGDGRYEPENFPTFTISGSELTWDWNVDSSNYTTVQASKEAALHNAAWQIESAITVAPYQVESPILADPASQDYLPIAGDDAGMSSGGDAASDAAGDDASDDGGGDPGAGETADQVRAADLAVLFPEGMSSDVWVTRIRADMARAALSSDLVLQASADQTQMSNIYQVTHQVNAPACPPVPDPCPPCATDDGGAAGAGASGGGASGGGLSGCSTATKDGGGGGVELVLAGLAAVAVFGKRRRGRR